MSKKLQNIITWLEDIPLVTEILTEEQAEALESLVGHEGFQLLLGLILAEKQGLYMRLANTPLVEGQVIAAAVIQGQIKGIERLRETLVEQAQLLFGREGSKEDHSNE